MKHLPLCLAVFLLIFLGGLGGVLALRGPERRSVPSSSARPENPLSPPRPAERKLAPLQLPHGITAQRCPENSWEYSGEIASNFVSARGRLSAWFQNQSWRPERQITLDAHRKPQIILTFRNQEYELTLLLWKIGTDRTGFSYRRDKTEDLKGEIIP